METEAEMLLALQSVGVFGTGHGVKNAKRFFCPYGRTTPVGGTDGQIEERIEAIIGVEGEGVFEQRG